MPSAAGLSYRESGPSAGPAALLVHGYPESSYMWSRLLADLGDAGLHAIAPDQAGFGDSPADPPGTWQRHVERLEAFRSELGIDSCALVVHDWGGLIGLRWACDHPGVVSALVISDTGFWPDGKWHGLAEAMRSDAGEEVMANMNRETFAGLLRQLSPAFDDAAIDEYWKNFGDVDRRRGQLELYRSGEFSELEAYEGKLAALGVPALIVWGEKDEFAPVAGAHRFASELPDSRVEIIEGAGHFVWEDAPERANPATVDFLRR